MTMDATVRRILTHAGWTEGRLNHAPVAKWARDLDAPGGFTMFDAARDALAEFGGLSVRIDGAGIDFAKGSFQIDPTLAVGEEERFRRLGERLSKRLYPLGEAYGGNSFLAVDEDGAVFLLMDDIRRLGFSMKEALEALILGKNMAGVDGP
jgi:hypothetical protein